MTKNWKDEHILRINPCGDFNIESCKESARRMAWQQAKIFYAYHVVMNLEIGDPEDPPHVPEDYHEIEMIMEDCIDQLGDGDKTDDDRCTHTVRYHTGDRCTRATRDYIEAILYESDEGFTIEVQFIPAKLVVHVGTEWCGKEDVA